MRKHGFRLKSHRNMVKEAFDKLPNGICFFNENGIPVLCNLRMHRLCFELLGCDLQSREELAAALEELPEKSTAVKKDNVYLMRDGTAWQFTVETTVDSYGETYTEYIAADVTRLNNLKAELEESNREQQENIRSIANISCNLAMITRNEEILKLKMKIHNELGESLRSAHHFLTEGCQMEKKDAFADRHIEMAKVLLGEVEREKEPNPFDLLTDIATAMGMNIVITGEVPQSEALRTMLSYAVRECLTNTIRHADGDTVYMKLFTAETNLVAVLTNNGNPPESRIIEGGGLGSLRARLLRSGGSMVITGLPRFQMKITLPLDLQED